MSPVIRDAVDNWPEDEAHMVLDSLVSNILAAIADGDKDDEQWCRARIPGNLERMRGILARESDGPQLIARFNAEAALILARLPDNTK